jgi:hypothetical protein
VIILILPVIAYAAADLFIPANSQSNVIPLPVQFYQQIGTVDINISFINFSYAINFGRLTWGVLAFTGIFWLIGLGLLSLVYSLLYRFTAPPRYIGYDSPPVGKYRPPK